MLSGLLLFLLLLATVGWVPFIVSKHMRQLTSGLFDFSFQICFLLASCLYLPVMGIFMMGARCEDRNGTRVSSADPSVLCMQGMHVVLFIVSVSGAALAFVTGLVYKLFVFDYAIDICNPTARLHPKSAVAFHCFRTAMAGLSVFGSLVLSHHFIWIATRGCHGFLHRDPGPDV